MHFDPTHEVAVVFRCAHRAFDRLEEARPACAAIELRAGLEQRLIARRAFEGAFAIFLIERARARALRAVLAQHTELIGRQLALPLVVRLLDCIVRGWMLLHKRATDLSWEQAGAACSRQWCRC